MSNFVRRIVSGNKARFKDKHLDLELDLVYVTDNIIIMGFPATGVEGFYRNRREDAKKFLDHRHGKNYWVFNFCPLRENSYPSSFFDGRVSRYPFPDHHAPPLAILPLFARECREWLTGSSERVAVLHCKAGKGRSGTLACTYLLSLDETPSPPKLQRSMTKKEWATRRADQIMETVETEDMSDDAKTSEEERIREEKNKSIDISKTLEPVSEDSSESKDKVDIPTITGKPTTDTPVNMTPVGGSIAEGLDQTVAQASQATAISKPPNTLEDVLALHTARRMKSPSSPDKKLKQGVSIPSQRRWLHYWSLLLAHAEPHSFWSAPLPRVRLHAMRVRIRETGGVKVGLLKLANTLIEKTNAAKYGVTERGRGPVWVSLARYNDPFVEMLERWEKHTRSEDGKMGVRKKGTEHMPDEEQILREIFTDGKWDQGKMIRSFTRLGHFDVATVNEREKEGDVVSHLLRPLTDQKWEALQAQMSDNPKAASPQNPSPQNLSRETRESVSAETEKKTPIASAASSVTDLALVIDDAEAEKGVILDAAREVRAKLYMGQVFLGWFWFIPAFHMPPPPSPNSTTLEAQKTHFTLSQKEVDFHIGLGASLVDVDVELSWVAPGSDTAIEKREPPKTQTSEDSAKGEGGEPGTGPGGVVAGIQAAVSEATGREAVEAVEASEQ